MFLLSVAAAQAAVLGGVAWVPVGIGALSFSANDGFSGTLASEWDGWIRPPLTAHAGWVGPRTAWLGHVAIVEVATVRATEEVRTFNVGGVRLGADWRRYVWAREPGRVNAWGTAGLFGIAPNAGQADSGWTEAEQTEADADSADRRAAIGGMGVQAGLGAEYLFADAAGRPAVAVGARWLVRGFGALDLEETETDFGMILQAEAALVVEFTR